jgi:septal ring factor EnvC (AmiA/AmiB activator)
MDRVTTTSESKPNTTLSGNAGVDKLWIAVQEGIDVQWPMSLLERANEAGSPSERIGLEAVRGADLSGIAEQIGRDSGLHLLVFYRSAPEYVASAMEKGQAPSKALGQWTLEAESLVAAIRRIRRRVSVIEHAPAMAAPSEVIAHLNQRLGLALSSGVTGDGAAVSQAGPLQRMIAAYAVQSEPAARRLQSELAAMALPVHAGSEAIPSADQAWSALTSTQSAPRQASDQLAREKDEIESNRQRVLQERDKLKHERNELKEENDLLLRNLHQVQEELESFYLEGGELEKKLRKTSTEKQRAEKKLRDVEFRLTTKDRKIEAMRRSLSWRLTKPLRGVSKLLKRRSS